MSQYKFILAASYQVSPFIKIIGYISFKKSISWFKDFSMPSQFHWRKLTESIRDEGIPTRLTEPTWPEGTWPEGTWPKVKFPAVKFPTVKFPSVQWVSRRFNLRDRKVPYWLDDLLLVPTSRWAAFPTVHIALERPAANQIKGYQLVLPVAWLAALSRFADFHYKIGIDWFFANRKIILFRIGR